MAKQRRKTHHHKKRVSKIEKAVAPPEPVLPDEEEGLCQECGADVEELYDDPRDPPLDEGDCLCADCYEAALEQNVYDAEGELQSAEDALAEFKKGKGK
jgi:hypothetical protein